MGTPSMAPICVLGRYALYEEIASGGMATVHFGRLASDVEGFGRTVAIKRLHPQFAKDTAFAKMFLDEARLALRIRHPNVVPTVDVVSVDQEVYLVMEYVPGESLARLLSAAEGANEKVPLSIAVAVMVGVLDGLHAAHEATSNRGEPLGLVHRDMSPQNVLLGVDGVPRVLDFGVAKAAGRATSTGQGAVKGKLQYMAPEQVHGDEVDRRTDVFAASIVLWECLTGTRLFDGEHHAQTIVQVIRGDVTSPRTRRPDVSPELEAIVMKGLSREPGARYATAREMARALEKLGPAPPSEIGAWVERLAEPELAERAARLASIERSSDRELGSFAARVPSDVESQPPVSHRSPIATEIMPAPAKAKADLTTVGGTPVVLGMSHAAPRTRTGMVVLAGASIVFLFSGVGLGVAAFSRNTSVTPMSSMRPLESKAGVTEAPPETLDPPDPTGPGTGVTYAPAPVASSGASNTKRKPPPPPPRVKPGCTPPYTVDDQGNRKYKRECL